MANVTNSFLNSRSSHDFYFAAADLDLSHLL